MKIIVTATGQDLDAAVDPRFGRCPYFAVVESESLGIEALPNPYQDAGGGAGTQAAQWVVGREAAAVLTGRCGPKAAAVLQDAGVNIVEGTSGSVREAVERFLQSQGDGLGRPGRWHGSGHGHGAGGGRGFGRGRGGGTGPAGRD